MENSALAAEKPLKSVRPAYRQESAKWFLPLSLKLLLLRWPGKYNVAHAQAN